MNWTEYRRLKLEDMQGRRYRTARTMRNGNIEIPMGTEVRIVGKRSGLSLRSEPCKCCGVAVFISRVEPSGVEELRA